MRAVRTDASAMASLSIDAPLSRAELIAHLRQFLIVIDPFGQILQIETGFDDLLGYSIDSFVDKNAIDYVAPSQADEIAAHFVAGGEHLIRGEHDMFEIELVRRGGATEMMDCLATRVHRDHDGNLWMLALTPHSVRAPEQSLIDDHVNGASAREMAQRFAQLRSLVADGGVWIETFVLDERVDGLFTSVASGRADSALVSTFADLVDAPTARWNQPIGDERVSGALDLLPGELADAAERHGVQSVSLGVASSTGEPELGIVGFGSHPKAFDGYVGRMEARSLGLLTSALSRERDERLLRDAAERDALTGLSNRTTFDSSLQSDDHAAVLYVDIDNFKLVNDTFGHAAGDAVLIELSRRMLAVCRPNDVVARIGGDEFAVLLHDVDLAMAEKIARRLVASVAEPMPPEIGPEVVTVSAGLAYATDDLMHDADMAMLRCKRRGRNGLIVSTLR
ncbi:hypothetical protein YM304_04780 [Ilumatobacter coccineus YM16-304]|uniref:GGDEF domain-containing protein n=2 Tax=Ilumatobacter coccineus TaxID=467094 RepID=A0A6C7E344_ILUCY|nr:hypothetical protein YM304_04780 [Ilumatobacter coccineus YM16-304]